MSNARGKQKPFELGKRYPIARERLTVKQKSGSYQTIGTAFSNFYYVVQIEKLEINFHMQY